MLMKDQLKIQMERQGVSVTELARRANVSSQSVRYWLAGRSFPGKSKCHVIEEALSFKLDFSEGESLHSITVEQAIHKSSVDTLMSISHLPADIQLLFAKLANAYARLASHTDAAAHATQAPQAELASTVAVAAPAAIRQPPKQAIHGRMPSRVLRKPVTQ